MLALSPPLAQVAASSSDGQWLALLALLVAVAALVVALVGLGRSTAAGRSAALSVKAAQPAPTPAPVATNAGPSPETFAIIAACVAVTFGKNARITLVTPGDPSGDMLRQQWSVEGRRQIYSSHQVR